MATLTLSRGSFLLVFPEDLNGSISSPTYAKVCNARGAKVTVRLETTDDDTGSIVRLSGATALTRKVDSKDAEGEQLGTWVRQAVCAKVDGYFRYGQVTGYSDSNLVINTKSGTVEATSGGICDSVYPVMAMIMGRHEIPLRSWSYSHLDKIHDTIMERLLNPTSSALTITCVEPSRSRCRERSYTRSIVVTFSCVVLHEHVEGLSGRLLAPVTQSIAACCSAIEEEGKAPVSLSIAAEMCSIIMRHSECQACSTSVLGNLKLSGTLGLLVVLIHHNLGVNALYHLAFVLETQGELLRSKLLACLTLTMTFRVLHFGVDFTFKFAWLSDSKYYPPATITAQLFHSRKASV
ncbi:uncharacterized protein IUM83_09097 [Phytophthora cinnamomi]|uniref:uncharacterized protein n=1 Tax=Phytophthora cinnamomi TaxID=4785 RepID=UPI003559AC27|nr:hypothetical protein IUM83_09097 [Phytophthora cinnamomi]